MKRAPHNSFPAPWAVPAACSALNHLPSACHQENHGGRRSLLGFNEDVSIGWVQHGFTNQLLRHGNRLVHGNAQIREVIQKPGGKREPKGYQSLLQTEAIHISGGKHSELHLKTAEQDLLPEGTAGRVPAHRTGCASS